jgi:hypothetical protein
VCSKIKINIPIISWYNVIDVELGRRITVWFPETAIEWAEITWCQN